MNHQVFMDMDGVLVDFESGVLKYMNQVMQEANRNPSHSFYKLAKSTAKEIGGWDVEITRWHIARPDSSEDSSPRNYRTRDFMYRLVEDDVELWENLEWERNGKKLRAQEVNSAATNKCFVGNARVTPDRCFRASNGCHATGLQALPLSPLLPTQVVNAENILRHGTRDERRHAITIPE